MVESSFEHRSSSAEFPGTVCFNSLRCVCVCVCARARARACVRKHWHVKGCKRDDNSGSAHGADKNQRVINNCNLR